jgi:hypothetical protein
MTSLLLAAALAVCPPQSLCGRAQSKGAVATLTIVATIMPTLEMRAESEALAPGVHLVTVSAFGPGGTPSATFVVSGAVEFEPRGRDILAHVVGGAIAMRMAPGENTRRVALSVLRARSAL